MPVFRRTKIIVTLGPATDHEETLRRLIEAGADVARLNFSHDDHESHATRIATVRRLASETGRVVAVMQDLQGPRIRTGPLVDGHTITLHDRESIRPHDEAGRGHGGARLDQRSPLCRRPSSRATPSSSTTA